MDSEEFQKAYGKIVAKAWRDEAFKAQLIADPTEVFREYGVAVPEGVEVKMVENTDKVVHFSLPPPQQMSDEDLEKAFGEEEAYVKIIKKAWSDENFKAELLANPATVLKDGGVQMPDGVEVKMFEATDKLVHFIIPCPSTDDGELSDEDLDKVAGGVAGVDDAAVAALAITLVVVLAICIGITVLVGGGEEPEVHEEEPIVGP